MSKDASGQVDPKKTNGEKRVKRGRLHFTEEVTRQDKEQASGQVGPKSQSTGKFRQDGEREKPSSRLRQEGEAREDTVCEEQAARKDQKDKREKKKERAEAKAEHSAVRLEMAKEKLSRQEPPKPPSLPKQAVMVAGAGVWAYGHRKIHEVEHENVGVEGAHKTELLAEAGAHKVSRYAKRRIREHPARQVRKWERRTIKADADLHYQKMVQENPELNSTFLSRMAQKWKIKREYAKQAREAARQTAKAAGAAATTAEKAAAYAAQFVRRHKGGAVIILLLFCLFLILNSVFSALPSLGTGMMNAVVGTSYTAEDEDILGANEDYTALENELREKIANIERTHPGYDEYRYNVDELGHNPYELTSYLIAKLRTYTRENVQGELRALFEAQYKLTLTEEVEIRYRTETDTWTDEDGTTHTDTYEVPYEYYILHVRLQNKTLPMIAADGVGLAGPQVGMLRRLFVVWDTTDAPEEIPEDYEYKFIDFVNPEILAVSEDEETAYEGCLSFPGHNGAVTRPAAVKVRAQDRHGNWFELEAEDLLARCIQHENDHLDGITIMQSSEYFYEDTEEGKKAAREAKGNN